MLSLAADIRIDPEHDEGPWHPRPYWKVVEHGFTLIMRDGDMSLPTLGDVWHCVSGLSRFMRDYGFSESRFRLLMLNTSGDGFILLARGALGQLSTEA